MAKRKKSKKKETVLTFYEEKHYLVDVENCPRCGSNHQKLKLYEIQGNPIFKEDRCYDAWAICPETSSPILIGWKKLKEE